MAIPTPGEKFLPKRVWSGSRFWMDEATLFKFDKWIKYDKSQKKFLRKGRGLGHVIVFEILNPLQYCSNGWGYAV